MKEEVKGDCPITPEALSLENDPNPSEQVSGIDQQAPYSLLKTSANILSLVLC